MAPANATPSCTDGGCDFECLPNFHRCGTHCAADDSVTECGALCSLCPDNGGLATCVQNACSFTCGANQARCQGQCVAESNTQCGASCLDCGVGASCLAGRCELQCPAGEVGVGGRCVKGREIEAGLFHACVRHDGGVVCWGPGSTGALGSGPYDGGRAPRFVSNLGEVASLALGDNFSCAHLPSGAVRCWGDNQFGQVGNGGSQAAFTPALTLAGNVTTLTAGARHACVSFDDAGTSCWGNGSAGQLGDGLTALGVRSPQPTKLDAGAVALFAGDDAVWAVLADGGQWFWGNDSLTYAPSPRALTVTDGGLRQVVAGANHACAIRADTGGLECWGRGLEGELGYPVATATAQPVRPVPGLGPVLDVCTGLNFSCALIPDGGVRCFGAGGSGELGSGNFNPSSTPVPVDSLPAARQLACHHQFACATTASGVFCWGDNSLGQLGAPNPMTSASPVLVQMP